MAPLIEMKVKRLSPPMMPARIQIAQIKKRKSLQSFHTQLLLPVLLICHHFLQEALGLVMKRRLKREAMVSVEILEMNVETTLLSVLVVEETGSGVAD